MCLGNILEDFSAIIWEKTRFNGYLYDFSVDYRAFDIIDIHKYLMIYNNACLVKKMFIRFLTSLVVNASSHTKCASLSNWKCEITHFY